MTCASWTLRNQLHGLRLRLGWLLRLPRPQHRRRGLCTWRLECRLPQWPSVHPLLPRMHQPTRTPPSAASMANDTDTPRARALLDWYAQNRRTLPWREQPTPYAVLVSELMAQQTRVETVLDYFVRWMARWPTLADLAAAHESEVLAQWTGLGYYNRARNLHRTAQIVIAQHGGVLPADEVQLRALPGIGPYTVGAIRSIAYGQPAALVDGNVARVLSRWLALTIDPMQPQGSKQVWAEAARWLELEGPRNSPSAWNQALMELGATVCTPRNPRCLHCPVANGCEARRTGQTASIPPVRQKAASQIVRAAYALLIPQSDGEDGIADSGHQVLMARRPTGGRWAGLWEPPGVEGADAEAVLTRHLHAAGLTPGAALPVLVHILTHRRYEVVAIPVVVPIGVGVALPALGYVEQRWMSATAVAGQQSGVSRLGQKLVALLG